MTNRISLKIPITVATMAITASSCYEVAGGETSPIGTSDRDKDDDGHSTIDSEASSDPVRSSRPYRIWRQSAVG